MPKKTLLYLAAAAMAFVLAVPPAQSLPFTGTLSLIISTLPPVPVLGEGSGPSVDGGAVGITSGGFTVVTTIPVVDPTTGNLVAFPIVSLFLGTPAGITAITATAGGGAPCAVAGTGQPFPGISGAGISACSGLLGQAKIGLFGPPPVVNLTIPLSVLGGGGTVALSTVGVEITAVGSGWTTGLAKVIGTTSPAVPTIASASGTDARTPNGGGTVVLVSPLLAKVNIVGSTNLALFGILTLNYVPEPGALLLLSSGGAGLALLGRRSLRK